MFYRFATLTFVATFFTLVVPDLARAQPPAVQHSVTAGAGVFNFDFSGTGNATGISGRGTLALTRSLAVEGNLLFAWPEQQFGPSRITAADAHLQFRLRGVGSDFVGSTADVVGGLTYRLGGF
jgi:hypothetical protein